MRIVKAIALSAAALLSSASLSYGENIKGEAVVLRALDKVTASTQDFTVTVGDTLQYGSLTIDVKHCEKRPPEDIPETYAFLQIFDVPPVVKTKKTPNPDASSEKIKVFSGWMLGSDPAVSALDHRVYDIWVLDCKLPPTVMDLRP